MTDDDGPWESGVRYNGGKLGGLAPLELLIRPDAMRAASGETLMAALFLRTGLQSLDRYLHNRDDFYPAALHLLGQGFEHLLKLTLALAQLRTQEAMGSPDEMKRIGHDLPGLRDQLVEQLLHPSLVTLPGGEGFLHAAMVLKSSSVNDYLLGLLSDHGRGARYFYLEDLLGRRRKSHPHDAFERWFDEIVEASRELKEDGDVAELSPLMQHVIADRPGAYRRERNEIAYIHVLGFLSVTAVVQLWLRGDGWEGPLRPLTRIRTVRRLPKEWRPDLS